MEIIDENNPRGDIEIQFTGLKPGEKLYEELLIGNNVSPTIHKRILKAKEDFISLKELENYIGQVQQAEKDGNIGTLKKVLEEVVSGYTPDNEIVDVLYLQKQKGSK